MKVGELVAGRYELEELIGTGGHSSVYRAHDTLLERRVALKLLHEQFVRDEDHVERFKREARAVAQLAHPNIVTVIDRGEQDGRQFIVFEFVEGENLKELVRREGRLPVERVLRLGLQMARALAFAHKQGLVHRDVKPQNVLIGETGQAKVTDFGIARSIDVQGLTQTGAVLGTSEYIAPEQARGERVDEKTDVYSLATVLYELLAGQVPFSGENFVAVALRQVNEPPPHVTELRPDVPARLDAALRRAMAKEPRDRFASMGELIAELEACLLEAASEPGDETTVIPGAIPSRPPQPAVASGRGRRRWPMVVALAVLLPAAAAGAAVLLGVVDLDGSSSAGETTTTTATTTPPALRPVKLVAVSPWDPDKNDGENDDAVPNATDGDPGTYWSTEGYKSELADQGKNGVGIILDSSGKRVSQVRVASDTPGFVARIQAGASESGPFDDVSPPAQVNSARTFELRRPVSQRYLVLWITDLTPVEDRYRAHVNEVTAKG